jgi:hypothetical protein
MALDLIAPEIPNAQQNKGPELFMSSLGQGLSAFAKFAEIRRQSESEVLKLAAQERISQEAHALDAKKLEAEIPMYEAHAKYFDAMTNLDIEKAKAYADGTATAAQRTIKYNQQKAAYLQEFQDRADKLRLNDPKLETDDPAQYYLNYKDLASEFGTSTLTGIPQALKNFKMRAEQHKIPLPEVTYDENGKNPSIAKGSNGAPKIPKVVVGQIVEALHNEDTKDLFYDRLKLGNYIKPGKDLSSWWQKKYYGPDEPTPEAKKMLDLSEKPIERTPTRNQPDFKVPATLPTDSSPPDAEGVIPQPSTDVDAYLSHARAAISAGAPRAEVEKRLQEMGIDTSQL